MKLKTLPRIIIVDDYHEFYDIPWNVQQYIGITVKTKELGYHEDSGFIGIVYQNKLPSEKRIRLLLKESNIELEEMNK